MGHDSSVGTANRHGPGIESRWGQFSAPVQTGPGADPAPYTNGTGSFPGVKRPRRGVDLPPPSSVEVKERVELYIYAPPTPFGPSWPVLGWPLPLLYQLHIWSTLAVTTVLSDDAVLVPKHANPQTQLTQNTAIHFSAQHTHAVRSLWTETLHIAQYVC